jgi:hypothetical protein
MILVDECGFTALIDQDHACPAQPGPGARTPVRIARVRQVPHCHDAHRMIMGLLARQ